LLLREEAREGDDVCVDLLRLGPVAAVYPNHCDVCVCVYIPPLNCSFLYGRFSLENEASAKTQRFVVVVVSW
jgi:hypothetical protein